MWQLQTIEHTNQDNNQNILIKGGETNDYGYDNNYYLSLGKGEETENLSKKLQSDFKPGSRILSDKRLKFLFLFFCF